MIIRPKTRAKKPKSKVLRPLILKELIEFFNEMDMNRIKIKSGDFEVELEKFADCCELPKPVR